VQKAQAGAAMRTEAALQYRLIRSGSHFQRAFDHRVVDPVPGRFVAKRSWRSEA